MSEATARVSLMQAIARLHRVEGTSLARRGMTTIDNEEMDS